ncbi:hypothetical protein O3P69_009292 [Scylla paramamosain]|uniref:Cuticle protein n=1 Tax=Scylla paramamosain TaxID=85552 RepID=A0AAW0TAR9_SCYPA
MAEPGGYGPVYPSQKHPYNYNYHVNSHYGANFGQHEQGDGKNVYGGYHVDLPDGRRQTVRYVADHYGGYVAQHRHPYHFDYYAHDHYGGTHARWEVSDGYHARGSYHARFPDGSYINKSYY